MRNFCRSPGAPILSGLCLRVYASMVFMSDLSGLMSLLCWLAWCDHLRWIWLARLYFYGVHVCCSEPEVCLSSYVLPSRIPRV